MKIRQHGADPLENESRCDKDPSPAFSDLHPPPSLRQRPFQSANRGCSDTDNTTIVFERGVHRPGRGFEALRYRFEIVSDYGAFRDLQRHRMLTCQWQRLSPDLGAGVPDEVVEAGAGDEFERALEISRLEYERLATAGLHEQAPYALSLAYRIRYTLQDGSSTTVATSEPSALQALMMRLDEIQRLRDNIYDLVDFLRKADRLFVLNHMTWTRQNRTLKTWQIEKMLELFEVVAISEELDLHKPDVGLFEWALREAGCEGSQAVMVGDRVDNDILPAKRLSMRTVLLRWPDGSGPGQGVPDLRGQVGRFLGVPGGRAYLVRVPGSAQAPLDDAALAAVLNWMIRGFGPEAVAKSFRPYDAAEVARYRGQPLVDVEGMRRELLRAMGSGLD